MSVFECVTWLEVTLLLLEVRFYVDRLHKCVFKHIRVRVSKNVCAHVYVKLGVTGIKGFCLKFLSVCMRRTESEEAVSCVLRTCL